MTLRATPAACCARFRSSCAALALLGTALLSPLAGQTQTAAAPFYTPVDVAIGLHQHGASPLATRFGGNAEALARTTQALCDAPAKQTATRLTAGRPAWVDAVWY